MNNLPRYTLSHDTKNEDWVLKRDGSGQTMRRFDTKAEATEGGVLEAALGKGGGSVRIEEYMAATKKSAHTRAAVILESRQDRTSGKIRNDNR